MKLMDCGGSASCQRAVTVKAPSVKSMDCDGSASCLRAAMMKAPGAAAVRGQRRGWDRVGKWIAARDGLAGCLGLRATGGILSGRRLPSLRSGGLVFARGMTSRWFCETVGLAFFIFSSYFSDAKPCERAVGVALTKHMYLEKP